MTELQPRLRGLMSRIVLGQLKIVDDCIAFERHFIVREMAQKPRIILRRGQLLRVGVAEFFKLRIKNKNAVIRIADMSRLLISSAAFLSVTAHEVPDAPLELRMRGLPQMLGIGPGAETVEAI